MPGPMRMAIARRAAVLFLGLAVAACSAGGPLGPDTPLAEPAIERGWITSPSGARLALYSWPAQGRTRAVILGLHGFGDSGEFAFGGPAVGDWTRRGIAVYAVDQRGFGANPSSRQWPGAGRLRSDAITVTRLLRARYPDVPLVVVGHSMGGGIALAAAAQGMPADGLVLVGPAIVGGAALNPALRAGGWAMATVVPERRWTGEGVVEILPTDNMEALRRAAADPRHFGNASSRELYGLVQVMDMASASAPLVEIPTLTLMGAKDEVLDPAAVRRVHDTIPGAVDFIYYPEGWHWLFADLQAPRVWRDVSDFVLSLPAPE